MAIESFLSRRIEKEAVIDAAVKDVWDAFTTTEGATTFFAPEANIELALNGPYELYFMGDNPEGTRGSEGCKVLSFLPEEMLSFTWNAPPQYPEVREQRTFVVIKFEEQGKEKTIVEITHLGWKEGEQWDEVYNYFMNAWDIVLGNLKKRFESGPLW